jgi:hypothetical protein
MRSSEALSASNSAVDTMLGRLCTHATAADTGSWLTRLTRLTRDCC